MFLLESRHGSLVVLTPAGNLSWEGGPEDAQQFFRRMEQQRDDPHDLILDCRNVVKIGDARWQDLHMTTHRTAESGKRLVFCNLSSISPFIKQTLERDFITYSTLEEALASFKPADSPT